MKKKFTQFLSMSVAIMMFVSCISCMPRGTVDLTRLELVRQRSAAVQVLVAMALNPTGQEHRLTPDEMPIAMSLGSGTVVASKPGKNLVLTAGHVCVHETGFVRDINDDVLELPVILSLFQVTNANGEEFEAEVVEVDVLNDLCILSVNGNAGRAVEVTDEEPPVFAPITYVGAPGGVWNVPAVPVLEGRYSGRITEFAVFSMVVAGGASGSGVFYNGKVFSVVTNRSTRFAGVSYGSPIGSAFAIVKAARAKF